MPKSSKSAPRPAGKLTFEEAFGELEALVAVLVKRCAELLDKAELKVRELSGTTMTDPAGEE